MINENEHLLKLLVQPKNKHHEKNNCIVYPS